MGMTLAEELELLLAEKCSSMCLDNEEERKKVAQTIAAYLHQEDNDDRSDQEKR
jgi:hypothetical protein